MSRSNHLVPLSAGERFGNLTAIIVQEVDPNYGVIGRYRCACGRKVIRVASQVRASVRYHAARGTVGPSCAECSAERRGNQVKAFWAERRSA